jgi:hypothetical protein
MNGGSFFLSLKAYLHTSMSCLIYILFQFLFGVVPSALPLTLSYDCFQE